MQSSIVIDIKDQPEIKNSSPVILRYLKGFNDEEIKKLVTDHKATAQDLEMIATEYWKTYAWYVFKYNMYLTCNIPYIFYVLNTAQGGANSLVQLFNPTATLPDTLNNSIGYVLASINFLMNLTTYSPHKEAIKSTLRYAKRNNFCQSTKDFFNTSYQHPKSFFINGIKFLANQFVLLTNNLTLSVSVVSDIYSNKLENLGPFAQNTITIALMGMCTGWFMKVTNPSYYEGLDFWRNKDNRPWLIGEVWRGNIAIPFQIFLQGMVSGVAISLFTSTNYFATAAEENFGWWLPKYIVLPLSAWQLLNTLYVSTYNHYKLTGEKISHHIRKELLAKIHPLIPQMQLPEYVDSNKIEHGLLDTLEKKYRQELNKQVLKNKPFGYWLRQKPLIIFPLIYLSLVGAFFGYEKLSPLLMDYIANEPISMHILGTLIGFGLTTILPTRAEREIIIDQLVWEFLENESKLERKEQKSSNKTIPDTCCVKTASIAANGFNVASSLSQGLSTIGTGQRLFGSNQTYMTLTAVIALQKMLNQILFYGPKIRNTWKSAVMPSQSKAVFFSENKESKPEPQKSYWCCWRRKKG